MARTKQNKVPHEFESLYGPILELKRLLQSKSKELNSDQTLQCFIMLHFASFVMIHFHKQLGMSTTKDLTIRALIELIMAGDSHKLQREQLASLFSFIDALGKELNTTYKPYIYIAMYQAYLDAEIYRHLHPTLGIYDFVAFQYVKPETVANMKQYHDVSLKVLEELNLSTKQQSLVDKSIKLNSLRVK
jgi:hypothetical protein